jgi:hypothetical protein
MEPLFCFDCVYCTCKACYFCCYILMIAALQLNNKRLAAAGMATTSWGLPAAACA